MRRNDVRWGLRVASRPSDGAGHVMRCLALAEALDPDAVFFLDADTTLDGYVTQAGFSWRAEPEPASAQMLESAMSAGDVEAAVIDGYDFPPEVVAALGRHGLCVSVDDFGHAIAGQAVINPGLDGRATRYDIPRDRVMAGPEYALLRAPFKDAHDDAVGREPKDRGTLNVLVAMGAVDSGNATGFVLQAMSRMARPETAVAVTVVLAAAAPHIDAVRRQVQALDALPGVACRLLSDVDDMIPIYRQTDLAVGAGGVSLLERLCCGVPSVLLTLADNQLPNAEAAARLGIAVHAGRREDLDADALAGLIARFTADSAWRNRVRRDGLAVVDGRGATRAAEHISSLHAGTYEHQVSL